MPVSDSRACASIAFRNARTFAMASRLLAAEKRRGAFAIYAFCRTADDIVDCAPAGSAPDEISGHLDAFARAVDEALRGAPQGAVLRELRWAVDRFDVPTSAISDLLRGIRRDLDAVEFRSWHDLEHYCEDVASSVGEMCTAVFGTVDGEGIRADALHHARQLGVAMQLTNILRDIGEDAERGRCYLPADELARHGLSTRDVISGAAMRQHESWGDLMRMQIDRAAAIYRSTLPGFPLLAADARRCAIACADGYARILRVIEANGFDAFTRRARLGWVERTHVLVDAWRERPPDFPIPRGRETAQGHVVMTG